MGIKQNKTIIFMSYHSTHNAISLTQRSKHIHRGNYINVYMTNAVYLYQTYMKLYLWTKYINADTGPNKGGESNEERGGSGREGGGAIRI